MKEPDERCSVLGQCPKERPSYTHNERVDLRKKIHAAGNEFFESLSDIKDLQYVAGEFMSKNEDWCILYPNTYGYIDITKTGFTQNQKSFLERLAKSLRQHKEGGSHV